MEKVEINCDENRPDLFNSEKQYDDYLLIGGLKLLAEDRQNVKSSVIKIRNKHNIHTEFKLKKVSSSKLEFYKELVNLF